MILDELGYRSYLNFRISSGQSEENIEQKLSVLKILGGRVSDFPEFFAKLERLEEKLKEPQTKRDKKPRVTLSTLHSSKGLEFEKVFIIDATEGQLPSVSSATEDEKAYAEEVRLFYVGATRAKKELIFLCVKHKENGIKPSPFISYLIDGLPRKTPVAGKCEGAAKENGARSVFNTGIKWQNYQGTQDQNFDVDLSAYQEGSTIAHQRFGKGVILEIKGPIANVRFEEAGDKKMNLAVCITNGVIR
jgi:DNA helicase-2/ATP-dependent DNA helicase PcrA